MYAIGMHSYRTLSFPLGESTTKNTIIHRNDINKKKSLFFIKFGEKCALINLIFKYFEHFLSPIQQTNFSFVWSELKGDLNVEENIKRREAPWKFCVTNEP